MSKKLYHKGREIDNVGIDYGDGNVMVCYTDTGDVDIVPKSEIEVKDE